MTKAALEFRNWIISLMYFQMKMFELKNKNICNLISIFLGILYSQMTNYILNSQCIKESNGFLIFFFFYKSLYKAEEIKVVTGGYFFCYQGRSTKYVFKSLAFNTLSFNT